MLEATYWPLDELAEAGWPAARLVVLSSPVPLSATVVGLLLALLVTVSVPVRAPAAMGLNDTVTAQEPPTAMAPQLLVWLKSRSARSSMTCCGSGSTAGPTASGSTQQRCSPRTRDCPTSRLGSRPDPRTLILTAMTCTTSTDRGAHWLMSTRAGC